MRKSLGEVMSLVAIGGLLILSLSTITTISLIRNRRESLFSRASGCPYLATSAGKAACESACGGAGSCTTCVGGGGYMCKSNSPSLPSKPPSTGGGGGNNLGSCSGGFYRSSSACIGACGANNCRECSRYGSGGYYECIDRPDPSDPDKNNTCPANKTNFYYESECKNAPDCTSKSCTRCYSNNNPRWYCGGPGNDDGGTTQKCSGSRCDSYFKGRTMSFPGSILYVGADSKTYSSNAICEKKGATLDAAQHCGLSGAADQALCKNMVQGNPYVSSGGKCYFCNNSSDTNPDTVDITKCQDNGCAFKYCRDYYSGKTMSSPSNVLIIGNDGKIYNSTTQCQLKNTNTGLINPVTHCGLGKGDPLVTCNLPDGHVIGDGGGACDENGFYYTCKNFDGTGRLTKGAACGNDGVVNNCTLPGTSTKLTKGETRCHTDGFNYSCNQWGNELKISKGSSCAAPDDDPPPPLPPDDGGQCPVGTYTFEGQSFTEQKVPCTTSQCGGDGCTWNMVKVTAGGSTCCFRSRVGQCVSSSACDANQFVYPSTTILQQTVTTPVVTIDGQTINCGQLTCIVL